MADPADLNLDAPSDLQDIPDMAMQLLPPPEGTYPDKSAPQNVRDFMDLADQCCLLDLHCSQQSKLMAKHMATMSLSSRPVHLPKRSRVELLKYGCVVTAVDTIGRGMA